MALYLIRHGKTAANEAHLYCGASDLPLSEAGQAELRRLHYQLPDGCAFVTSGMLRTEQTLSVLFGDVSHRIEPRFREVDFGRFELHSYDELKNDPDYVRWISGDNEQNVPPDGESGVQMRRRVLEALAELDKDRDTVLIAHGGTIALILEHLFPGAGKNRYEWQPRPGCGYCVRCHGWTPIP